MAELARFDEFVANLFRIRERIARMKDVASKYEGWPNSFPKKKLIEELLWNCFYLSLEQYEGHPTRTSFHWMAKGFGKSFILKFAEPIRGLELRTLRTLAQVADAQISDISLRVDSGEWVIEGIQEDGAMRLLPVWNKFVLGINVTIQGAGIVEYREGNIAYRYNRGKWGRIRYFNEVPTIAKWIEYAKKVQEEHAIQAIANEKFPNGVSQEDNSEIQFSKDIIPTMLRSFFYSVLESGRGGALIVVPHKDLDGYIDIRYPAEGWGFPATVKSFGTASTLIAKEKFPNVSPLTPAFVDEHSMLRKLQVFATGFAHLSRCDGAVVMTRELSLLGFGGMIRPNGDLGGNQKSLQRKGARHLSAAWLCRSLPETLAIIVSSDRTITVFEGLPEEVRITEDLSVW